MKALCIATKPKWVNKIINGEKDLEFRNYAIPKGTRVLVYCTKEKPLLWLRNGNTILDSQYNRLIESIPNHLLNGKVVLEFTVGECKHCGGTWDCETDEYEVPVVYGDNGNVGYLPQLQNQGYANQKYAHTITDLIVYDEEWIDNRVEHMEEFIYNNDGCNYPTPIPYRNLLVATKHAPTEPQPITNYVGWKKWDKEFKRLLKLNKNWATRKEIEKHINRNTVMGMDYIKYPLLNLTHPPQGRVWIYMEE